MMNIGFDAKRAFFNHSGLGNYSRTLILSLCNYFPEHTYELFVPGKNGKAFDKLPKNITLNYPQGIYEKLPSIWRSFGIGENLIAKKNSIYHGLSNELPFNIKSSKIPSVVTIHDLIFLRSPELYPFIDRKIYKIKFRKAALNADVVVATSIQTKDDLINMLNIPEEKIKVVYQSCDPAYFAEPKEVNLTPLQQLFPSVPSEFLLSVGTIEERKNLLNVLKAIKILNQNLSIPLVVIGRKKQPYFKQLLAFIDENQLQNQVIFLENVSNHHLKLFYQSAKLLLYTSFFEGFGIPVLEALLSGTPVITSKTSSLPEVAGPFSTLINPESPEEIAGAIERLLSDPNICNHYKTKGRAWAAEKFHPQKTAGEMVKIYSSLLGK
jgi:glycosyltransferase involved in cell wall biosynthesis